MFLIGWKSPILMSYWLIKHQQLTPSGLEKSVKIKSWLTVFCWHKHHETGTVIAGSGPPGPVTTDTMCLVGAVLPSDQSAEQSLGWYHVTVSQQHCSSQDTRIVEAHWSTSVLDIHLHATDSHLHTKHRHWPSSLVQFIDIISLPSPFNCLRTSFVFSPLI